MHDFVPLITEAGTGDGSPQVETCRKCGLFRLTTIAGSVFYLVVFDPQFAKCSAGYNAKVARNILFGELGITVTPVAVDLQAGKNGQWCCEGCGSYFSTLEILTNHERVCIGGN